jgi:hypothetical protein
MNQLVAENARGRNYVAGWAILRRLVGDPTSHGGQSYVSFHNVPQRNSLARLLNRFRLRVELTRRAWNFDACAS